MTPARSARATAADFINGANLIIRLAEQNEEAAAQVKRLIAELDIERQAHEVTRFQHARLLEQRERVRTAVETLVGTTEVLGREAFAQPDQPDPPQSESSPPRGSPRAGDDGAGDAPGEGADPSVVELPHPSPPEGEPVRGRMLHLVGEDFARPDERMRGNKLFEGDER